MVEENRRHQVALSIPGMGRTMGQMTDPIGL